MAYPESVCRAVFQFGLPNGTNGYVTPHFKQEDGGSYSLAEVEGLADLLADWWQADDFEGETNEAWRDHVSEETTLQSITVTSLAAVTPVQAVVDVNTAGTDIGNPLPNEASVVTTLYTGIVGRSYRGRNFWPGLSSTIMDTNGTLQGAELTSMQTTFDALRVGIKAASNSVLCVHSPTLGLATEVTSMVVRDVLHHQRRRNS